MDLPHKMNLIVTYIEDNLHTQINYSELAKFLDCSVYHFQRMFSFLAGVPLAEYIRRRKLTLAAFDLKNTNEQIIEISLKYGYESPEAFSRAFKSLHGVTPTSARKGSVTLKSFPPISFQISIKGSQEINYKIENLESFNIVANKTEVFSSNIIEDDFSVTDGIKLIWENAFKENLFEILWEMKAVSSAIKGILGVFTDGNWGNNDKFNYSLGVISNDNISTNNFFKLEIPKSKWVVFEVEGEPDKLVNAWKRLYTEWLPMSDYELSDLPAIENYLPIEENKNELWIPIIEKEKK